MNLFISLLNGCEIYIFFFTPTQTVYVTCWQIQGYTPHGGANASLQNGDTKSWEKTPVSCCST